MILAILLAAHGVAGSDGQTCRIGGGEAVPTAQVAREVAEAILRSRQTSEQSARYTLQVAPAGKDAWDVVQAIPPRTAPNGDKIITDGGGLVIRVDRCDGRIAFIQPLI